MQGPIRRNWLLTLAVLAACQTDAEDELRREATTSTAESRGQMTERTELATVATGRGTILRRSPQIRHAVVGRRNADGTITTSCVDDADSVAALMRDPSPALAPGVAQ